MAHAFEGKVALITGGGAGIGEAVACELGAARAHVIVTDISLRRADAVAKAINASGGAATAMEMDVASSAGVDTAFDRIVSTFGRLDIAINNAGIGGQSQGLAAFSEDEFDRLVGVNFKGIWLCMRRETELFRTQTGGAIVNVASALGLVGSSTRPIYAATKHAVLGLTKSAAIECATQGIRVNAVCPGAVHVPAMDRFPSSPERLAEAIAAQPIGRLGTPGEVAAAIVWLASPAASFVTGACLPVDGGWTA